MEGCIRFDASCVSTVYCSGAVTCMEWVNISGNNIDDSSSSSSRNRNRNRSSNSSSGSSNSNSNSSNRYSSSSSKNNNRGKQHVMFGTTQSEIKVWDISKQCFSTEFRTKSSHPIVTDVCHHSSTNVAAVSSIKKTAWDLATTYKTRNDTSSNHSLSSVQLWRVDHRDLSHELISDDSNGCVTKIVMNNNGTSLVTGSTDGIVRIYDIQTHTKIHSFNAHMDGGGVGGLIYRNDSILVTCGRKDGNILDWDVSVMFIISTFSSFFFL